ncbi:MAG: DUF881 domain-containing protein, partial [Bifidobacteriaceae bacterium]|nr:DUF881 domain-containing protein [Bifidobacteriaceae bacterium]
MTKRRRRRAGAPTPFGRQALSVGLVAVLAGWLFAWNAGSGQTSDLRDAPGLRGMATSRDRAVASLQERQTELAAQVEALVDAADSEVSEPDRELAVASGTAAVTGPGLTVTMDDADPSPDLLSPAVAGAELLVHQQDIDAVLNALWAGGAEAVAVQGHRVASATAIKCVGNVILVGGRVYSPPYLIEAIGPAGDMRGRLDAAAIVRAYRERAARLGLVWNVAEQGELKIDGDT